MKLVIACEIKRQSQRSSHPRPDTAWDLDSEHLSREGLAEIESALVHLGYDIEIAESYDVLLRMSQRYNDLLCVNLSVGHGGPSSKVFTAALLEILGIPYVGSPPHALAISRDKSISKALAQWMGIPTPWWTILAPGASPRAEVEFPVIVKPVHESCSIGIHVASVIHEGRDLMQAVTRIWDVYRQPAIIEQYVPGVDVEVPFLGGTEILGFAAVVPRFALHGCDILTATAVYRDAYDFMEPDRVTRWSSEAEANVQSWVLEFAGAAGIRDYGRVDFRVSPSGDVYFIEASTHPYLARHSSFAWLYEKAGQQYEGLWDDILRAFFRRHRETDLNANQRQSLRSGS